MGPLFEYLETTREGAKEIQGKFWRVFLCDEIGRGDHAGYILRNAFCGVDDLRLERIGEWGEEGALLEADLDGAEM